MNKKFLICLLAIVIVTVLMITLSKVSLARSDETIARVDRHIEEVLNR